MRLLSYRPKGSDAQLRGGWIQGDGIADMERAIQWGVKELGTAPVGGTKSAADMPSANGMAGTDVSGAYPSVIPVTLQQWLGLGYPSVSQLSATASQLAASDEWKSSNGNKQNQAALFYNLQEAELGPPLPRPSSFRDFYAFEEHVKTARSRRGLDMVPQWYDFPVFYFSNAAAIIGPEDEIVKPRNTSALDYELEIACVIGKQGINIAKETAEEHIAGFMILNDWSARDIQREEVKVGLGPAKGKDFATSIGPCLVTPDELADRKIGDRYDLRMVARINGSTYSEGNFKSIYWTFGDMIARASEDCMLYPGEIIGSGTVGTGCILELGSDRYPWLQPGDVVELEIERLGILRNRVKK
jgi:fumarylacetoacetate (FAA) hydrolase